MLNSIKVLQQLKQQSFPVSCDEGVFRIMLDVYLKFPEKFKDLVPMLGGFHMAKCVQRYIGKYVQGTGLEDALVETGIFGVKIMESFIAATNYVRLIRWIQVLSSANEMSKWNAFWKVHDVNDFKESITAIEQLAKALKEKDKFKSQQLYKECKEKSMDLMKRYERSLSFAKKGQNFVNIGMESLGYQIC